MAREIKIRNVVALLHDVPTEHFASAEPLLLRGGQIGAAAMTYPDGKQSIAPQVMVG